MIDSSFLLQTYYGNTIQAWFGALLIVLASVIVGKVIFYFFQNHVERLTRKSKSKFDDILVDMVEEPIVLSVIILGIWYAIGTLTLSPNLLTLINDVLHFLIALNIAWLLTRLFDSMFTEYMVPLAQNTETDLDDQLLPILRKGTKLIIWVVAVIVALNNAGYDVMALIAGLGIGGLALAMAAKDLVSNIFGGFTIFADRPFKLKDRIKVSGFDGTVSEIGLRSTRLVTLEGREVAIPNSTFTNTAVENVSSEPSRKVTLNLGLTYDTTPKKMRQALDILKKINADNSDTEDEIKLSFNQFNDSSLNIMFIYYIRKGVDIFKTQNDMDMEILTQFNKKKLEFAYPTQTIYVEK